MLGDTDPACNSSGSGALAGPGLANAGRVGQARGAFSAASGMPNNSVLLGERHLRLAGTAPGLPGLGWTLGAGRERGDAEGRGGGSASQVRDANMMNRHGLELWNFYWRGDMQCI
jgi:hypothetical protein